MDFSNALEALKYDSQKVARSGWNGKGMWLVLVSAYDWNPRNEHIYAGLKKSPWIAMKTADGNIVPWQPSQTDMLAEDWEIAS